MQNSKQQNFIKKILEKAKAISKSEKIFKVIKKLKQSVETVSRGENMQFQKIISLQPRRKLLVYHFGQGLQPDLNGLRSVEMCEETEIVLKTGSPYGTIQFKSQQQSARFMDTCVQLQGSDVHYLQIKFAQNDRIVFYFYLALDRLWDNNELQIQNCSSFQDHQPISGLHIYNEFLTSSEQQQLVRLIDSCKWIHLNNRKVQHYGFEFKYGRNNIDKHQKITPIPEFFQPLLKRISSLKLAEHDFDQLTINCYDSGDGIPSHFDTHSPFQQVFVSISLLGDIVMDFRSFRKETKQVLLRGRSMAVFSDEARYAWFHGITGRKVDKIDGKFVYRKRRISLTFRKIKFDDCKCRFYFYCDSQGYDQALMKKTNPLLLKYLAHQNIANVNQHTQKQLVQHVYNQFGHTFSNPIHPKVCEFIKNMQPSSLALDIGCGNGNYLSILLKSGHIPIGMYLIDNYREKCVTMKGEMNQQRIHADATQLPFRNNIFDSVVMVAVFHHFSTVQRRLSSLFQIERVLKIGGDCMITVWSFQHKQDIYEHQDVLIDFTLPQHRSKNFQKQQVFKRYYHLFKKEQILELVAKTKLHLVSITEEYDNYYIILQKQ